MKYDKHLYSLVNIIYELLVTRIDTRSSAFCLSILDLFLFALVVLMSLLHFGSRLTASCINDVVVTYRCDQESYKHVPYVLGHNVFHTDEVAQLAHVGLGDLPRVLGGEGRLTAERGQQMVAQVHEQRLAELREHGLLQRGARLEQR